MYILYNGRPKKALQFVSWLFDDVFLKINCFFAAPCRIQYTTFPYSSPWKLNKQVLRLDMATLHGSSQAGKWCSINSQDTAIIYLRSSYYIANIRQTYTVDVYGLLTIFLKKCFSALYQLHLVKSKTARAFIPKEFRLVEAFGYSYFGMAEESFDNCVMEYDLL